MVSSHTQAKSLLASAVQESFGWVKPDAPIDHPAAKQREGKIYMSKKAAWASAMTLAAGHRKW